MTTERRHQKLRFHNNCGPTSDGQLEFSIGEVKTIYGSQRPTYHKTYVILRTHIQNPYRDIEKDFF